MPSSYTVGRASASVWLFFAQGQLKQLFTRRWNEDPVHLPAMSAYLKSAFMTSAKCLPVSVAVHLSASVCLHEDLVTATTAWYQGWMEAPLRTYAGSRCLHVGVAVRLGRNLCLRWAD